MNISNARRSRSYQNLLNAGLVESTSDRQKANGTVSFTGNYKLGKKAFRANYQVSGSGKVRSNHFTVRQVKNYGEGFEVIAGLLANRIVNG